MPVFTIISDWHRNDYYAGALKGYILSRCPDARIIDISNTIEQFNIAQAAFILRNSYNHYPKGTIHLICVKSETKQDRSNLVIQHDGHYFIGADNGIFGLLFKDKPEKIYRINENPENIAFPELSVFANTACHIALKKEILKIAENSGEYYEQIPFRPTIEENVITGSVIYIDSYQNAITNVTRELFERVGGNKPFEIFVQSHHYKISKINKKYGDTSPGELLAIFNSVELLEIAINNGNAAELLNIGTGSAIRIKFKI